MIERLTLPGLIDAHVHLREPGATHKENAFTGTAAALAGGIVGILDMPNNTPPTVSRQAFLRKQQLVSSKAVSDYGLFVGYDGQHLDEVVALAPQAVGLKLYLDETFGDLTLHDSHALERVFEAWPGPGPIAIHGESPAIAVALTLARRYGQRLHVCHVPHPDDLLAIADARQRGTAVTCEVTPHHLFLSQETEQRLGAYARMKPPLLPESLRQLMWNRLDLVDMVATDHAPHTRAEKESPNPPPGVPGLETMLPLLLYAVDRGLLSLERLLELCVHNPLAVMGLRAPEDSSVDIEAGHPYRLRFSGYRTRCGWSPFVGCWALGRVVRVRLRGRIVWERGHLLAAPGSGQPLQRTVPAG